MHNLDHIAVDLTREPLERAITAPDPDHPGETIGIHAGEFIVEQARSMVDPTDDERAYIHVLDSVGRATKSILNRSRTNGFRKYRSVNGVHKVVDLMSVAEYEVLGHRASSMRIGWSKVELEMEFRAKVKSGIPEGQAYAEFEVAVAAL